MALVDQYLRHIKKYGTESVLEGLRDDRSEMTQADVVAILRAYCVAGGKLTPQHRAQADRALTTIGWKQEAIADLLNVSVDTVQRSRKTT